MVKVEVVFNYKFLFLILFSGVFFITSVGPNFLPRPNV